MTYKERSIHTQKFDKLILKEREKKRKKINNFCAFTYIDFVDIYGLQMK